MNRQQKELVIKNLQESFNNSQASFIVGYQGMTVHQMQALRNQLREKGGKMQVAKARLMKRAVEGLEDAEQVRSFFKDQIALVFAENESPAIAKVLYEFSKENEALKLIIGRMDSQILNAQAVTRIASLPSREVLLGQVCGTLNAPIQGLASVLNTLVLKLLWTLKAVEKSKQ
jgi:large subunit ribosomal protein L10